MKKRLVISAAQMFSMLFISRLVVETTYSAVMSEGSSLWDHILSSFMSFILVFILLIPLYYLFGMDESKDILDNSYELIGKSAHIISFIYVVYFMFTCVHTLALFKIFLSNVINPPISTEILLTLMVLSACYGAYKGVEGIARTSGVVLFFIIGAIIFMGISLYSEIDIINFDPFLYEGNESMFGGVMFMISRSSCIPALTLLLPMAKGDVRKGAVVWNAGVYSLIGAVIFLMTGAMGDFLQTQLFPVYAAASIAKIGTLEHLDALYLGIWTMGIFIKLALFLMLSGECAKKIVGEKIGRFFVLIFGAFVMLSGILLDKNAVSSGIFASPSLLLAMLFTGVVIPIICIVIKKSKMKGEGTKGEN